MYICQKAFENFSFSYTFSFQYRKSQIDIFIVPSQFERKKKFVKQLYTCDVFVYTSSYCL